MPGRYLAAVIGAAVVLILGAVSARPASADGGPHVVGVNSGLTTLTADSCAGCHRAHSSVGEGLLVGATTSELCLTCHGSVAAGATTNVADGVLAGTGRGLRGGGFLNASMDTSWTATAGSPAGSRASTSAHMTDSVTLATMWGNGPLGSAGVGPQVTLDCISCHNPHGNNTYRILRPIPTDSGAAAPVEVADGQGLGYTVSSPANRYFGQSYGYWPWIYDLDMWCAQCHTRYDAVNDSPDGYGGPGHTNSGDAVYTYRHMTRFENWQPCGLCHNQPGSVSAPDPLGVGGGGFAHEPVCQACHVGHGSAAQMGTFSGAVAWPDGATTPAGSYRSSLLRLDNRGVCAGCHDPTR